MNTKQFKFILSLALSLFFSLSAIGQKYSWKDEVELLKRIDLLPAYRSNCIVEQISSYDRTGGNDDGFSGKYSYVRKEGNKLILADLKGPGIINRIWTPTPTNDTLSFYFDGEKTPRLVIRFSDLFSGKVYPFVKPICGNEVGGFYCYIPIPYNKSCRIEMHGEKNMFYQIQYRNLPKEKVETYTGQFTLESKRMLDEICKIWNDIYPTVNNYTNGLSSNIETAEKSFTITPGQETTFFETNIPGRIVGFEIDGGNSFDGLYKDVILSADWDNEKTEAIYAPVADFFGYAYGKGSMRSMLIGRVGDKNYCYMPMPFDHSAKMKLIYKARSNVKQNPIPITIKVFYNSNKRTVADEGKFYSTWRRQINPPIGKSYEFLNIAGKGHYVGTVHIAQGLKPGMTLFFEGDDSTSVDGKMRMHGTGSEDAYNGGWYAMLDRWDRGVSLPLHGCLDYSLPMARTGAYRFFLTDKLSFEKEIYHGIEHGPEKNEFPVDYTSVAYYYAAQPLTLKMEPTDELREVYLPKEHVYFPQLMDLTLGGGVQVIQDRGLRINVENENMVRVMLNDVPEGKYSVSISYFEKPDGADFCIWQRQKQLTDWKSTKNNNEIYKEKVSVGEIELTKQTNSISFHVRQNDQGKQFELDRIYLDRIN